ncbi:MAG: ROK family protein [Kiritimatiellia bacterium]|nr:ROK family protein [Kiritimatiellia bacterium]
MGNDVSDKKWLGFDLGGTKMQATVLDSNFKKIASFRKKTRGTNGSILDRILLVIEGALQEAKIAPADLAGIGFGVPGPLDLDKGVVIESPNLGWKNLALRKKMEDAFRCPTVIGNDVDVGAYGEYRFGAAKGARCALAVFPGTGIGGACIYEGKLFRGKTSSCMEIGHVKVQPEGRLCGCGRRGCLETVASRLAISAEAAMAIYRGDAPKLAALAGTDLALIRSKALSRAIDAGDKIVETIVRRAARAIGLAVSDVVNLLAPDVVVLGGGLVEALPKLFVEEVEKAANEEAMATFRGTFKVKAAELGDDAVALGAAALASNPAALRSGS